MKATSTALKNALQGNQFLMRCTLYTFTLLSGTVLRYTDWGSNIVLSGNTFLADKLDSAPGFVCGKTTTKIGLSVDSTDIDMIYDSNTRISGVTPGAFANAGGFDGATVSIDTLFMLPNAPGSTSLGTINRYTGIVDTIRGQKNRLTITVASMVSVLAGAFPRNYATPQCNHALFDSGCTLNKASFAVAGTVTSDVNQLTFAASGLSFPNSYFAQGSVVWLTGANAGITSQVTGYVGASGQFTLIYPLPGAINPGDTFTAYPGCAKTRAACGNTNSAVGPVLNNLIHFRGYPYVPTPNTLLLGSKTSTPGDNAGKDTGNGGTGVGKGPGGQVGKTAAK